MRKEEQIRIIEQLLDHIENKSTQLGTAEVKMPVGIYFENERFEKETEIIFRKYPLIACHASEIAEPGSYTAIEIAGLPLLITRDAERQVHAMLNVCRHRGTRLLDSSGTGLKTIRCPYHNWVYDLNGCFRGMPHKNGFSAEPRARHLKKIQTFEFLGFIFVMPHADEQVDFFEYLGALNDEILSYANEMSHLYRKTSFAARLNWKLVIDLFLEVYHVKSVHKDSIAPIFHDNVYVYERSGLHLRTVNPKYRIDDLRGKDKTFWNLRKVANVEYILFPNTIVLVEPNHIDILVIYPETPDSCRVDIYALTAKPARTNLHERAYRQSADLLYRAIREDIDMGERIQSGLRSGANTHLTFGLFEEALDIYHRILNGELAKSNAIRAPT